MRHRSRAGEKVLNPCGRKRRLQRLGVGALFRRFCSVIEIIGRVDQVSAAARIHFTGRIEHDDLPALLPVCEAQVMPSTFPEAFGMVAVEAAACGVLPLSAAHSGMAEVTAALAPALPEELRPLLS